MKRVRLEEIMPIPKVIQNGPRQKNRTRIARSRVLTDPEEMNQLQLDYLKKQEKEQNKDKCKKTRSAKPLLSNKENNPGKGKLVAGKSNMNSVPEKEPLVVLNRQPRMAKKNRFLTQNYLFD